MSEWNTDPSTWQYQYERACAMGHVLARVVGVTHEELNACGCAECELVREGMIEAGYLAPLPAPESEEA